MSRRGAKPVPTALKVLRGTLRAGRRNDGEAAPGRAVPSCPPELGATAKREWKRISRELAGMGLLGRIDRAALALYCDAWGRWVEAIDALRQYGVVMKSPNGYPMQSPYLAIANKAAEQVRLLLGEFGMSPSSRTRVRAEPAPQQDDDSEFERLFGGHPA